jgi:hypothetical protein
MGYRVVFTTTTEQHLKEIEDYIAIREGSRAPAAAFAVRLGEQSVQCPRLADVAI